MRGGGGVAIPRLKEWRIKRGYSQPQLADRAGVGKNTVWILEQQVQTARITTVKMLADALEITPEELY